MAADPKRYFNSTGKYFIHIPGYTSFCGKSISESSESDSKKRK